MENAIFNEPKVSKAYIRMSLPLVFSLLVTLIYNLADTFFVGQTGDTNIVAGVSLGMPVFTVLMAIGNIFGLGGSSLMSRLLGEKNHQGIRRISSFCFYISIIIGVLITIVMLVFRVPMVYLIGASKETFFHAYSYYCYLAIGAPAIILSFIHSNLLRSEGMSKEAMIGTIIGALINIILDPIFITVLGLGAGGAAIATIIGYVIADVFFIIIVLRKSKLLCINPKEITVPAQHVSQILGIGIPAAVANLMQSASIVLMNQFLLSFGDDKIAAMGIVLKVSMIALLLLTGFSFGGQPLFGYYYGARDKQKMNQLFKFSIKFIMVLALVLTVIIFAFAPALLRCFIDNENIVSDGIPMLRYQVITMVFVGIVLLITIIFQAAGKVMGSFILSISRQGIIFLFVLIISYYTVGYMGILLSQAISDVITAAIALILFFKQLRKEFY